MFWWICWQINIYFLGHFFKAGYIPSIVVVSFGFHFDKKDLRLIAFVFDLAGQSFSQFLADSRVQRLLFPSFLLALIMH